MNGQTCLRGSQGEAWPNENDCQVETVTVSLNCEHPRKKFCYIYRTCPTHLKAREWRVVEGSPVTNPGGAGLCVRGAVEVSNTSG